MHDWKDEDEVRNYLVKLLHREAFDKRGLIYGMGHAVYSISDPRAQIFKGFVEKLAKEKGRNKDYGLYSMVERLAPQVIAEERHIYKGVSANVDFTADCLQYAESSVGALYPHVCHRTYCRMECSQDGGADQHKTKLYGRLIKSVMPEQAYTPLHDRK